MPDPMLFIGHLEVNGTCALENDRQRLIFDGLKPGFGRPDPVFRRDGFHEANTIGRILAIAYAVIEISLLKAWKGGNMEQTDIQNEQIKLRATFINGLAIGIVLIGVFTPITRAAYDPFVSGDAFFLMAGSAAICFALGFVLHYYAARHLDGLKR